MAEGEPTIEVEAKIASISAHYKQKNRFDLAGGPQANLLELDPDYVTVSLAPPEPPHLIGGLIAGNLTIKKTDARKMNFMIGDTIKIKVTRA